MNLARQLADIGYIAAGSLVSDQAADDDSVIPELRQLPASLDTRQVAEVLNIVNPAEVSGRLAADQWPGFRIGVQWRMRRSVVQRIMLGLDPWEGQHRPNQPHGQRNMRQAGDEPSSSG